MKKIIIIVLIIFCGLEAFAQKGEFQVLTKSGEVQVKHKSSKKWEKIKTGDNLAKQDEVKLSSGGYLGLYHSGSGQTIELTKAGTYQCTKLAKQISSRKSNLTAKFADYVANELSGSESVFEGDQVNMQSTGAVDRALNTEKDKSSKLSSISGLDKSTSSSVSQVASWMTSGEKPLNCLLPRNSYLIDDEVSFVWQKGEKSSNYTFKIVNRNDNHIYSKDLNDTTITVNIKVLGLKNDTNYYWYVVNDGNKSFEYCINRMGDAKVSLIEKDENELKADDELTPLKMVILAAYYEEQNIVPRAIAHYKQVLEASPDNEEFDKLYRRYLKRLGIFTEQRTKSE